MGQFEEPLDLAAIAAFPEASSSPEDKIMQPSDLDIDPTIPAPQRRRLTAVLAELSECFATTSKVRQTAVAKHRIVTDDNTPPVHQSPYRVFVKVIQKPVQGMLDDNIIQPSSSRWTSPAVLVKKKDGTLRFCADYRRLNSVAEKDVYPLPRIDDTLNRLRHTRYFPSIDFEEWLLAD